MDSLHVENAKYKVASFIVGHHVRSEPLDNKINTETVSTNTVLVAGIRPYSGQMDFRTGMSPFPRC